MTDDELLEKKLAFIESCLRDLTVVARPERIGTDIREQRFIAHTLQLAVQAALDVASHIVSDERLGEPSTNAQLFDILRRANWIPEDLSSALRKMAGFRNILVHGYQEVDTGIMRDVVDKRLGDLTDFIAAIRSRLRGNA